MNNYQWLLQMDGAERKAWFDAEHVETEERALDGDTAAQDGDSRYKLEADVRKIAEAYNMDTQRHGTERFAHELYYSIIYLLDRQEIITAEEASNAWEEYRDATQREIAELTAERDELKGQVFTLKCECDDLESTCNVLENEFYNAKAERERYREKFGKCLGYADAIHALMDDEGMA